MKPALLLSVCAALVTPWMTRAQPKGANYDESKVPAFTLPDPLVRPDGTLVQSAGEWENGRRAEVFKLFEDHVYGRAPGAPLQIFFRVVETDRNALGGLATRKQIQIQLTSQRYGPRMDLLLYIPNQARRPVPVFLGLNFYGNHTIHPDPAIRLPATWCRDNAAMGVVNNRATEAGRGKSASRWPVEKILERDYAVATVYYGDIEADHAEGWMTGLRSYRLERGRTAPAPDHWGAIGAWAWGLSRVMDYLEKDLELDHRKVALLGHSRLGKTSLWAGASDRRFALVISNNSGCGGAALSRRAFGETVGRINTSFPHWFNDFFNRYNGKENELPVDQHALIALIAPRPVYIASAEQDQWADPRGEFLSGKFAEPVYALYDRPGLGVDSQPPVNIPVGDYVGYHIRSGKHDVTDYDWDRYLYFADRHFAELEAR